jgi:hypothetical protein
MKPAILVLAFFVIEVELRFTQLKTTAPSSNPAHVEKFNYGIPCKTNTDCEDPNSFQNFLICDPFEDICICDPFSSMLNLEKKSCMKKVHYSCNGDDDHPFNVNAESIHQGYGPSGGGACVHHAICDPETQSCRCKEGFLETFDGTCAMVVKFGEKCDESGETTTCGLPWSEIECLEGKCQCKFGTSSQFYDKDKHICVSYEGADCAGSCVANTDCVEVLQKDKDGNISYPIVSLGLKCVSFNSNSTIL